MRTGNFRPSVRSQSKLSTIPFPLQMWPGPGDFFRQFAFNWGISGVVSCHFKAGDWSMCSKHLVAFESTIF